MIALTAIGHTLKPHGKEGLIRLRVDDRYIDDLQVSNALFIEIDGSRVPFLYNDIQIKNHILIKLDEVDDPQVASKYSSKSIFIESKFISAKDEDEEASINDLLGFKVYNAEKNYVGSISEIIQNPHQFLLEINAPEKAFLMPFHPDLVIEIDQNAGAVYMEIIEGIDEL